MTPVDADTSEELVQTIRGWVRREVVPHASALEHADEYPEAWIEQMKQFGLLGARIPPEHGGFGLDTATYARLMEELAYGWMSLAGVVNTHMIVADLIDRHGTPWQRGTWLPRLAAGEPRAALSLSEPDAGSDTRALRCRAEPDGDDYVINGTKMWITNGERAGLVALAARTPEGITCFLVEKVPGTRSGGVGVSRRIPKLGYKGIETVEMSYEDHRVPASAVLGGPE
ncbi:MAG: acyl-CoA dehydrogenase family protein, partial [Acidimicrobiales bacterium]